MDLAVHRWGGGLLGRVAVTQVWLIEPSVDELDERCLTVAERDEFDAVRHGPTRRARRAARAGLRHLLGAQLRCPPEWVQLGRTALGQLVLTGGAIRPHLSVSHTTSWCAVALSRAEVGIDVERADLRALREAAPAFLNRREAAAPDALLPLLWTGKESVAKAAGSGFTRNGPADFVFTVGPGRGPVPSEFPDGRPYRVWWLRPDSLHVLAVAVAAGRRSASGGAHDVERSSFGAEPRFGQLPNQVGR
ncbi:MAG: 4'-phosphopantetheinyl transferase family protein [Phycicoccus sp.]